MPAPHSLANCMDMHESDEWMRERRTSGQHPVYNTVQNDGWANAVGINREHFHIHTHTMRHQTREIIISMSAPIFPPSPTPILYSFHSQCQSGRWAPHRIYASERTRAPFTDKYPINNDALCLLIDVKNFYRWKYHQICLLLSVTGFGVNLCVCVCVH